MNFDVCFCYSFFYVPWEFYIMVYWIEMLPNLTFSTSFGFVLENRIVFVLAVLIVIFHSLNHESIIFICVREFFVQCWFFGLMRKKWYRRRTAWLLHFCWPEYRWLRHWRDAEISMIPKGFLFGFFWGLSFWWVEVLSPICILNVLFSKLTWWCLQVGEGFPLLGVCKADYNVTFYQMLFQYLVILWLFCV